MRTGAWRLLRMGAGAGKLVVVALLLMMPDVPGGERRGEAAAADGEEGRLNAVAYQTIPANLQIHVRALDNSETSLELKADFEDALRANGWTITPQAGQWVLTLDGGLQFSDWTNRERSLIQAERRELRNKVRDRYAVNLFDSETDRPPRARPGRGVPQGRYRVEGTLDDRFSGRTVWRGWAVAPFHRGNSRDLAEGMIPVLAASFGRTVRDEPFALR